MGNLKISKTKKNKNSKGSSGIPNWLLSTLVIIVVVAVLATCIGTFVASSGITMRLSTAVSLGDDYKVSGNMMSYFYQTTYMNFMNSNSSYMSYLSFDQNVDPKLQPFNPEGSYDSMFLQPAKDYETWFDYFMDQTKDSVKNLLVYCAEAKKQGVTLTADEMDEIDISIENLLTNIRLSFGGGLSDASCLANVYGDGVSKSDVRKAMELSALASKMAEKLGNDIETAITDERINKTYDDNKLDFDLVDYFTYSFDVYYDDVIAEAYGDEKKAENLTAEEKTAVLELYKKKIDEAKASAKELSAKTTLDEFRTWVVNHAATSRYNDTFDSATSKLTSEQKPAESDLATIKEKTIAAVIKEVNEGKEAVTEDVVKKEDGTYTLYDINISKEFYEAAKTLKADLFKSVKSAKDDGLKEGTNYIAPDKDNNKDELSEWAFSADRKVNDVTSIETGDGAKDAALEVKTERFTAEVVFLTKTVYRDETLSRNAAYMLFAKEEDAKKAIEALGATEGLDKDKFIKYAQDSASNAAAHQEITDYIKGQMQSEEFDKWLFGATTANEYTKTAIKMSDGSFMVIIYLGEGTMPTWKYDVKSSIYNDDYVEYEKKMNEEFASNVVFNDKVINKVGA